MTERVLFMSRLAKGERMSDLCREFGISRKTGYKFWARYKEQGPVGLADESRAPKSQWRKTSDELQQLFIETRQAHPTWGGRKLKAMLEQQNPELRIPSAGTIAAVLKRHGLVAKQRPRRRHPYAAHELGLTQPSAPNDVWAADYKGQFRLGNSKYCYPLTISDLLSRFVVLIEATDGTGEEEAQAGFTEAFRTYGLPQILRTDNGSPFASRGLAGLTKLSAWWLRLGIRHERTAPASPEQNGQHERMHRTLKAETTRPAGQNQLQQQERFDRFRQEFNAVRPHEALKMKRPADLYRPSKRKLPAQLPELTYPLHDDAVVVRRTGHIHVPGGRSIYLTEALIGQPVGIRERDDGGWLVTFADLDLGIYRPACREFEPNPSPFGRSK